MFMLDILLAFVLILVFSIAGGVLAIGFQYLGDWVFDRIADTQEWQQKKGWW